MDALRHPLRVTLREPMTSLNFLEPTFEVRLQAYSVHQLFERIRLRAEHEVSAQKDPPTLAARQEMVVALMARLSAESEAKASKPKEDVEARAQTMADDVVSHLMARQWGEEICVWIEEEFRVRCYNAGESCDPHAIFHKVVNDAEAHLEQLIAESMKPTR
jgi:hypothetical protein